MSRITPPSAVAIPESIEDDEFYPVTLLKLTTSTGSPEYGSELQLQIDWEFEDSTSARDWVSLRLGKQQNGTIAKLRQLLNAISGKKPDVEVAWFDSESFEWGYEKDGDAHNRLQEGAACLLRGKRVEKKDGQFKFVIDAYRPIKAPAARVAAKPAKADVDEIPF